MYFDTISEEAVLLQEKSRQGVSETKLPWLPLPKSDLGQGGGY